MAKPDLPQHKPGSPWGKLVATYNFASSSFWHHMISTQDHFYPASWWLSILTQLTFAGENGPRWVELDRCANGAARLVGIPSNLSLNFNIPMKHRQIGGQSLHMSTLRVEHGHVGVDRHSFHIQWFQGGSRVTQRQKRATNESCIFIFFAGLLGQLFFFCKGCFFSVQKMICSIFFSQ